MSDPQPAILCIIGPTASGKSDCALKLAQRYGAEILSCDSLLVYRGLDIGTAKPSVEELKQVRHHGIDIASPEQAFTAGDYVRYARPILDQLMAKRTPAIIVGGTGFYLKGLLCGIWDAPPTQPEIRERLEKKSSEDLYGALSSLDPEYALKVKPQDRYRLIRALEIIEVSGEPVTQLLLKRELQNPLPYPFRILGIKRPKAELERRIIERTNMMFSKGIVNETRGLLERHGTHLPYPRSLSCVGYDEVVQFLSGKLSLPDCRERIVISTRQLAKKQMTFFKTFPAPIEWFELPSEAQALENAAASLFALRIEIE